MKFQRILGLAALSACGGLVSAAPGAIAETALKVPEKSLETLIHELADPQFHTREDASRRIWAMGESALPALQGTAAGKDPEQAYRAAELIRKIQFYLTPDTDPAVIQLTESWEKAGPDQKVAIFAKLNAKRAWRQILKLYASETSVDLQLRLLSPLHDGAGGVPGISGVAVVAARERLAVGDAKGAREFLEMAPADAAALLALADFHRSQGTLETELKRAKSLSGHHAAAWQLALYRAGGNLEQAKISATVAGELKISAMMSTLLGDPLPWLQLAERAAGEAPSIKKAYTVAAIRRWQGLPSTELDLQFLEGAAISVNRIERQNAICALFLLGESALAEPAFLKNSMLAAFTHYESQERIPEALTALGLDPQQPDYTTWVGKRFESLTKDVGDDDRLVSTDTQELITLASFMERRGLVIPCEEAFLKPLAALAAADAKAFTELLGQLFSGFGRMALVESGAPRIAKTAAAAWAGDDEGRWDDVVAAAFGEQGGFRELQDWMAELAPKSSRAERFDGLLAVAGLGSDPARLRRRWLDLAWAAIEEAPAEKRKPLLGKMRFLVSLKPDVATSLKLQDRMPAGSQGALRGDFYLYHLAASGRWQEAAEICLQQIEDRAKSKTEPAPSLHAIAASCLRKAGRAAEAARQDRIVETLALGHDALQIASGYSFGSDHSRAAEWLARAACQADPEDVPNLVEVLQRHQVVLLESGKWSEAAAVTEAMAQTLAAQESVDTAPLIALRLRLQSDLGHALANLKNDRAGSISTLKKCHQLFLCDGSLADDFFPALRQAGLTKQHDEWFDESWAKISAVIVKFPDSDNTCNTAAWLASRALRNLDQAEKLEERALAIRPDQYAYLDTMAEIQFAKGSRRKAIDWSSRAVNFSPGDPQLRRQNERFRSEPMPR
jgi:tetratricopeptide (TPR) repeat protein